MRVGLFFYFYFTNKIVKPQDPLDYKSDTNDCKTLVRRSSPHPLYNYIATGRLVS